MKCHQTNLFDIPLMQILSILSYNAAKHLGDTGLKFMQERGRTQEGMVAGVLVGHKTTSVPRNRLLRQVETPPRLLQQLVGLRA